MLESSLSPESPISPSRTLWKYQPKNIHYAGDRLLLVLFLLLMVDVVSCLFSLTIYISLSLSLALLISAIVPPNAVSFLCGAS